MPSETAARGPARSQLSDPAIRAQLERILASDVFARSQQLRRFLSFVVEQTVSGQGPTLKESVLAHELYGKGTDFDGGTDPVVRVDARRLRDKLREYYQGRSDPIIISLPKGSYAPVFEPNSASIIEIESPGCSDRAAREASLQRRKMGGRRFRTRRGGCSGSNHCSRTPRAGDRSGPVTSTGLVPRCRGPAHAVTGW